MSDEYDWPEHHRIEQDIAGVIDRVFSEYLDVGNNMGLALSITQHSETCASEIMGKYKIQR